MLAGWSECSLNSIHRVGEPSITNSTMKTNLQIALSLGLAALPSPALADKIEIPCK
jgi:hypothetical protein